MGYFSNGSEGEDYHERYCSRCVHDKDENCPVWLAHLLYSYRDCNVPESILHLLIPRESGGLTNGACLMFIESPATGDLFGGEQP
jgi:hypothetical protein